MSKKMNPEIKARWVAALRSGEYKQGKGELRSATNEFCCLGVLCDIQDATRWTREFEDDDEDTTVVGRPYGYDSAGSYDLPPRTVLRAVGLDVEAEVRIDCIEDTLYCHNDLGRTFAEIADAIEAQL